MAERGGRWECWLGMLSAKFVTLREEQDQAVDAIIQQAYSVQQADHGQLRFQIIPTGIGADISDVPCVRRG